MPLTADHFRRDGDWYANPAHEDADDRRPEQNGPPPNGAATSVAEKGVAEHEDSESGLPDKPHRGPEDDIDGSSSSPRHRNAGTNVARSTVLSKGQLGHKCKRALAKTPCQKHASPRQGPPAPNRTKRNSTRETVPYSSERPSRRLPVNELVLVASPVDHPSLAQPPSYVSGHHGQDPISDQAVSIRHGTVSPVESREEPEDRRWLKQKPLSAFKERLRGDRRRHKSISDLRKKRTDRSQTHPKVPNDHGDGFNAGELFISPLARTSVRKRQPRHDQLIPGFGALQLRAGPLPDVVFDAAPASLKVEGRSASPKHDGVQTSDRPFRRVSFGEQRQAAIIAQLSSISAPPLPRPVADGRNDEESQDDEDDEDDCDDGYVEEREGSADTELDEDQIADGFQAVAEDDLYEADTETAEDLEMLPIGSKEANNGDSTDELDTTEGVNLDLRRHVPGHWPRRRIRQDPLIEVNEATHEVVGIDSMPTYPPQMAALRDQNQQQAAGSTRETTQSPHSVPKRPRSILKNATQTLPEAMTQPEQTAANTRSNSTVELPESRYFTDAANMLRNVDPTMHTIVPRRRPSYFDEVETFDNGAAVLEMTAEPDTEMLNYAAASDLAVLRRSSEAEWTPQSLPTAPRDLGSLTRSVSRDFGTLSQSVRRRPSLPFHSPTKTQRAV